MRRLVAIALLAAVLASQATAQELGIRQKQKVAAQIARTCGLPKNALIVRSDGSLRLRPKRTESYRRVNCALGELQKKGLISRLPKAYVGNERDDGQLN